MSLVNNSEDEGGGVASAVLGTKRGVTDGRWREAAWGGDGSHGVAAMVVAAMMVAVAARDSGGEMASGGE
nr:hypothetical protein [Tanacetum cinerariifolium]